MKLWHRIWQRWRWLAIAFLAALGLLLAVVVLRTYTPETPTFVTAPSPSITPFQPLATERPAPSLTPSPQPSLAPETTTEPAIASGSPKFGHFPYLEGDSKLMYAIGGYAQKQNQRFEKLLPDSALALMRLIYAARDDGVWIVPVSGFRTVAEQTKLFDAQIQKRGSVEAAAKISAPPGYSEHHTGYAVDLTDGRYPKQDITYEFVQTDAFQWLTRRAQEFDFELSFPEHNAQGVSYEPWHWRFIGSPQAAAIFHHKSVPQIERRR